ncbi:MAG: hypothetical protein M3126_06110 [Candidatus Eremiobacteraeota bacterium]|nr:hypothetical protein [Candidatus Eremiobacteraeota bacterium]
MSIDRPDPIRLDRANAKTADSIIAAGQRQIEAVRTAAGAIAGRFIGTPPRQGFDLRHLGIGRNVDVYA